MSNYRNNLQKFARLFRALSNPNRLAIYSRLAECCTLAACCPEEEMVRCVGELNEGLNIVPSTISHHIKELRTAGLINMRREGKKINCWADAETLLALREFIENLVALGRARRNGPA